MGRILVTGGAGFIGSNIAKRLVELGHEVSVADNLFLGRKDNLKGLDVKFYKTDLRDEKLTDGLFRKGKFEYVFHEAGCSSAPMFDNDPRHAIDVNVRGFMNVLQGAKESGVKRVIYASTSSLYHDLTPPHIESMNVVPKSFYTISKYVMEICARQYLDEHGVESIGMRYFSVYGPNELHKGRFANIISQFLWVMRKGQRPVIYGDGSQARDFTYVDDVVDANIRTMRNGKAGEVYNIGTGSMTTFNQVVELLNKHLGKNIKPKHIPNPVHNYVPVTGASTEKAQRELGFVNRYELNEGIKKLVEFYSK
ncbi:MAG: NAD-dependent epimerase/dehydratase family protein [Candidatus Micrarchaeota archaeon]|nr:NAD-dependent epimerase/dehydratase family protein [Candidatus Micrarchaeota archaeon]